MLIYVTLNISDLSTQCSVDNTDILKNFWHVNTLLIPYVLTLGHWYTLLLYMNDYGLQWTMD